MEIGDVGEISVDVSEAKLEETRRIVASEIAATKVTTPGRNKIVQYLVNFECWLPNGLNRKFSDKLGQMEDTLEEKGYASKENSSLRVRQTDRQFYETVDKVLIAEGFDPEVMKTWQGNKEWFDDMDQYELREKILPVYIRLRAMGYTEADLNT